MRIKTFLVLFLLLPAIAFAIPPSPPLTGTDLSSIPGVPECSGGTCTADTALSALAALAAPTGSCLYGYNGAAYGCYSSHDHAGSAITYDEVLIDCAGSADPYAHCTGANASTLTAAMTGRTLVNSYGRGEAQTVTLPAAAKGMAVIFFVGTQHNSAWKVQRAGSDTITWSSGGTDTAGKTYFQETNQAVGSRVSCVTFKSGASAYTWLCGPVTGTWVTD